MTWSIERTVAVLTPVFAAGAALLSGWLAKHALNIPPDQIVAPMIAGFTAATAAALKWLHGRAQYVALEKSAKGIEAKVRAEIAANPQATLAVSEVEALLKAHAGQVQAAIDQHVPAAVGQALQALFSQLGQPAPPAPVTVPVSVPPAA